MLVGFVCIMILLGPAVIAAFIVLKKSFSGMVTQKRYGKGGVFPNQLMSQIDPDVEQKATCSFAALSSNVIRCDDDKIMDVEIKVAYEYFEKRFYSPYNLCGMLNKNLKKKKIP